MQFEFKSALTDLDQRTPTYFLQEIFHHGKLKVRKDSLEALSDLDPGRHSARILREILKIY